MRVGILDLLKPEASPDTLFGTHNHLILRQYACIPPQAVSLWCRQLGHETHYATYFGQSDPKSLLPNDLDVVFIGAYTRASALAYALAKLYRREGTLTVIGGAHAKAFPEDCLRFFDLVVQECDKRLIDEILRDRPKGEQVTSGHPLLEFPAVEERLPDLKTALFWKGRPFPIPLIGLLASIGCPYRCDFCTDWDRPYTLLPLDRLETDLRFIAEHFPSAKVGFHDASFAVRFDLIMEVIERSFQTRGVGYMFESTLSSLSGSRLPRLRDTGCWYASAGVESWSAYSNKTMAGPGVTGEAKLERVTEHYRLMAEYVPMVQANFIFGIDSDEGDEPVRLTREFIRRAPFVWPNICIPTPFGGTPLFDRYRSEGRILETMPFAFYNSPYLVAQPKHYHPADYYDRLTSLVEEIASAPRWIESLRIGSASIKVINSLRTIGVRNALREFRSLRDLLHTDTALRVFHEGRSRSLPAFYEQRWGRMLGPYADLLTEEERTPLLPLCQAPGTTRSPYNVGSAMGG
jgi:radical SAM superfamily enzyme YgiQ (UPF0313 family)